MRFYLEIITKASDGEEVTATSCADVREEEKDTGDLRVYTTTFPCPPSCSSPKSSSDIVDEPGQQQQQQPPPQKLSERRKIVVMVCDDEKDVRDVFCAILRTHFSEYEIMDVCSGKQCIDKYFEQKNKGKSIDILLLDYDLGDMDGGKVARIIKEDTIQKDKHFGYDEDGKGDFVDSASIKNENRVTSSSTTKIVLVTGRADELIIDDLRDRNYIDCALEKPVRMKSLNDKVSKLYHQQLRK